MWDPEFYLNLSLCSHRLDGSWVCYLELQSWQSVRSLILSEPISLFSQVGGFLGLLLWASILIVYEILDFIWTFLSVLTVWRIPGSVTWSFNPHCLWDPGFYLNISLWSHRFEASWICYLELQSSLSVRSLILSEPISLFSQVGGFLGLLLWVSILTVCGILDFILTFLSIFTGWRIPGSVTMSFNPHCLWDPRFHCFGAACRVGSEENTRKGHTRSRNGEGDK